MGACAYKTVRGADQIINSAGSTDWVELFFPKAKSRDIVIACILLLRLQASFLTILPCFKHAELRKHTGFLRHCYLWWALIGKRSTRRATYLAECISGRLTRDAQESDGVCIEQRLVEGLMFAREGIHFYPPGRRRKTRKQTRRLNCVRGNDVKSGSEGCFP
jgi:hypothetical protein